LQSELVLQWPQVPLEHVPKPAQSDVVLQYGSAAGPSRIAAGDSGEIAGDISVCDAANAGTGTAVTDDG
jgi:hypothetical protein